MASPVRTQARTRQGLVEGLDRNGIATFLGVPYAAPPVGLRRWRAPEKPESWSGVRDAKKVGNAGPQNRVPLEALSAFVIEEPLSEDCLYLNVWTPSADGARRPVLVWIHGGAFTIGSGAQSLYDGEALARRGDVVIVTINYRLGALGFLRLAEVTAGRIASTGNEGILDQVAALEWVRDNIAEFGGDPDNVTIFGESAGGMSVGTLLGLPRARGLFHKAIPQSGGAHTANPLARAQAAARRIVANLGLRGDDADALRATSPVQLLAASAALTTVGSSSVDPEIGGMPLQPVIDGAIQPRLALESVAAGSAAGVPLLVGSTLDEWRLFGAMDPTNLALRPEEAAAKLHANVPAAARAGLIEAYRKAATERGATASGFDLVCALETDRVFRMPALRLLETQARHERRVYSYLYTWRSPFMGGMLGSCHAVELAFVFGTLAAKGNADFSGSGPAAEALAERTMETWLAFAKSGDPSTAAIGRVPAYTPADRATLLLGEKCAVERAPYETERRAWDGLRDEVFGRL